MSKISYKAISAADFFYRNRDIAGFDNPTRAIYTAVRELVENSLDACEDGGIIPELKVIMKNDGENVYQITVEDNGIGVPRDNIQSCFGRILYGSKYTHRQARGRFGLGGKMAFLYGQITTHKPLHIISSAVDADWVYDVKLRIDIQSNQPELLEWNRRKNGEGWHGTIIEFSLEGDWSRARKQIVEYIRETALITPYATILFIDPDGILYYFASSIKKLPEPPTEVQPHPVGVDVERVTRIIDETKTRDMVTFMRSHFHRVGQKTAQKFLKRVGVPENTDPKSLTTGQIVDLVRKMKTFGEFLPPDAKCLSPLGEDLLKSGIEKELKPDFVAVTQRPPSSYGGHPFIVEVGIAYGGEVPRKENIVLYRYANRIPLLYDEYKDVSAKVIRAIPWSRYKIKAGMPIAVFVHIISTKLPFKTAGKEFIADRPELETEIRRGIMECARQLMRFIQKKERIAREIQRINIYEQYLPLIVRDVAALAEQEKIPDYGKLIEKSKILLEETKEEIEEEAEEVLVEAEASEMEMDQLVETSSEEEVEKIGEILAERKAAVIEGPATPEENSLAIEEEIEKTTTTKPKPKKEDKTKKRKSKRKKKKPKTKKSKTTKPPKTTKQKELTEIIEESDESTMVPDETINEKENLED
ncbi:MAG: DNA topoisomerase VI subunit B [Candidatus Lokiarchaeia archaeon]